MNRKELGCATLGALLGAAGCSPAARTLLVPEASAEQSHGQPAGQLVTNLVLHLHHPSNDSSVFLAGDGFTVTSSNSAVLHTTIDQSGAGAVLNLIVRGTGTAIVKLHRAGTLVLQINAFVHAI